MARSTCEARPRLHAAEVALAQNEVGGLGYLSAMGSTEKRSTRLLPPSATHMLPHLVDVHPVAIPVVWTHSRENENRASRLWFGEVAPVASHA